MRGPLRGQALMLDVLSGPERSAASAVMLSDREGRRVKGCLGARAV